jgi:hypothetical protein
MSMEQSTLSHAEFAALLEYSVSVPTGTTIGKRWRAHHHRGWVVGEYVAHSDAHVGIRWTTFVQAAIAEPPGWMVWVDPVLGWEARRYRKPGASDDLRRITCADYGTLIALLWSAP